MAELYRENQKFNQWWIWLLMLVTMFAVIVPSWMAFQDSGDLLALVISVAAGGLAAVLFAMLTLRTVITSEGIEIGFRPFSRRRIFRSEIAAAYVRKYSPLGEYGGWGYRIGSKGKAYNVSGNYGLQLEMKNGEKLLIGTQHPEILEELMADYLSDDAEDLERLELKALQREKAEQLRGRSV